MIIAAARSIATYLAVSFYVLIAAPLGILLAVAFGWKGLLYVLGHIGVCLALRLSGIRYELSGTQNLPTNRAAVYCANHQSNVDPPLLYTALHPRMHVLYKHEINKLPLLPRAFRLGGFLSVDRRDKEAARRSIEDGAQSIRSGNSFLIFPEGTRSKTGRLLPFKKGGFAMAIKAHAPVVPVAVQGGGAAMRKGSWLIWPTTVKVSVGQPIETVGFGPGDRGRLIVRVRAEIERLLGLEPAADKVTSRETAATQSRPV